VEQLDGTISVQSEVGRGTTFTIRLPSADSRTAAAAS
jgi:chemotaxis protein histidine kinase CheA